MIKYQGPKYRAMTPYKFPNSPDIWNSQPWMKNIEPSLLRRLWEKKGCPGILVLSCYGITMTFTQFALGILQMKQDRNFGVFYHAPTRPVRSSRAAR